MADLHIAAHDDPRFAPHRLRAAASQALAPFERVRTDAELVALWVRHFDAVLPFDFRRRPLAGRWHAEVLVRGLSVVTLRSVGTDAPAEAVIRARLRLRRWPRIRWIGPLIRAARRDDHDLWLTLTAPPGGDWRVAHIDLDARGEHHLVAEHVAEAAYDPALRDAAFRELAEADEIDAPAELVSSEGAATRQVLDLSLVDGRFAPAVIEAAVRSTMRAWRRLALGHATTHEELAALSTFEVASYARSADLPAKLRSLEIVELVRAPRPALFLRIAAIVQVRDGARKRDLWWRLELDDELDQHWRLVDAYARPELRELRATEDC